LEELAIWAYSCLIKKKFYASQIRAAYYWDNQMKSRLQWSRGLGRGSAAIRLLGLRVRISLWAWMSLSCECCVLSDRGLCDGLFTRPEEAYRVRCV
jgi:hypothetical protein